MQQIKHTLLLLLYCLIVQLQDLSCQNIDLPLVNQLFDSFLSDIFKAFIDSYTKEYNQYIGIWVSKTVQSTLDMLNFLVLTPTFIILFN